MQVHTFLDSQSEVVHRAEDKERAQCISQTSSEGYTSAPEGAPVGSEAICGANRKSSGEAHRTPVEWQERGLCG
jgi:hypothetical protein